MSAYIIVQVDVKDPEGFAAYREMVPETLEAYGGKYLVRGGAVEILEGSWSPPRIVVLAFDSVEQAKRWWDSEEYREAKLLRQQTTSTEMIVVEGYEG
jgi:uncharacterized protein (DUF1330 family)